MTPERIAFALMLLCVAMSGHARIALVDDAGRQVVLDHPARRIIVIAPHLAELAHAAGAGERLLATVRGSDYPPEVLRLPVVGDATSLDYERIRLFNPDLILAWGSGNKSADIARLAGSGLAVFVIEPRRLDDIARHLRIIGELAATQPVAEAAAAHFEARLRRLRNRYAGAENVDVLVEIWHQPLFTVGPAHPISNALQVCAARNVLPDYPLLAGPVPLEDVLIARADVIVSLSGRPHADVRARWDRQLPLGRRQPPEVLSVHPDLLARPGPRMLDGIELLCARLDALRARP